MDLSGLLEPIRLLDGYQGLRRSLAEERDLCRLVPLPHAARIPVAAALAVDLAMPVLYVVARSDRLLALAEELPAWEPALRVLTFPSPNALFYEVTPWGPRTIQQRIGVLAALTAAQDSNP